MLPVVDGHCDVLYQLWNKKEAHLFFQPDAPLHCSLERLRQGGVKVQTFAVFVPPEVPLSQKTAAAIEMIDILSHFLMSEDPRIRLLKQGDPWPAIEQQDDYLYVLLSLEGAEPIGDDLTLLRMFNELGVSSMGLTWNSRNLLADGVGEPRPGGLSHFGIEVVREMNRLNMAIDISHMAEPAFWDVLHHTKQPIIASHCNAKHLCNHPRNLSDEQIKAIFETKGMIGVNFVPFFLNANGQADVETVIFHLDHLLSLGGEDYVGFGSDFDGISETLPSLQHSGEWPTLVQMCQNYYSDHVINKLFYLNWQNYYFRLWNYGEK